MISSHREDEPIGRAAETAFREAFERLKSRRPINLPMRSPITQANVAREAGKDPSALRKSRFPELVSEIQRHVLARDAKKLLQKNEFTAAKITIDKLRAELAQALTLRDQALSQLMTAELTILELRGGQHSGGNTSNVTTISHNR